MLRQIKHFVDPPRTFRSWHFGCAPESVQICENAECAVQLGHLLPVPVNASVTGGPFEKEPREQAKSPVSWATCPPALQVFAEPGETSELTL